MSSVPITGGAHPGRPVSVAKRFAHGWGRARELAHGFRIAWISTVSVVAGIALFLMAPQAQDLFLEVRGRVMWGTAYWTAFYVLVVVAWMFPVYVSARWVLWRFREGETDWTAEAPVAEWVRRMLPRLLVTGCLVAVLTGQIMALTNAPTILDEGLSKSRTARLDAIMETFSDCRVPGGTVRIDCALSGLVNSIPQYMSHLAADQWGTDRVIVVAYVLLAIFIFYAMLRRWLLYADPATTPLAMKIGGWVLWGIAGILKIIAGLVVFLLMFVLAAIPDAAQEAQTISALAVGFLIGFFCISLSVVWSARRLGWTLRHGLFSAASNLMLAVPFLLAIAALAYGFAINEIEFGISLGHLALLPAVTMVLMWLTWRAMATRDGNRATWLGSWLLRLIGREGTTAAEATTHLVGPLFYFLMWTSLALMTALAFVHPVDTTRQLHRALLLPVALGFLVPAFTWLSWFSFWCRAPFVVGLVLVTGLVIVLVSRRS